MRGREVTIIEDFSIDIIDRANADTIQKEKLFFINLGGYKENEFEEYHYKILSACTDKGEAVRRSKQTTFYKHTGFKGAESHVDEKYGIDVDDIFEISDILSPALKQKFSVVLTPSDDMQNDEIHCGYIMLEKLAR